MRGSREMTTSTPDPSAPAPSRLRAVGRRLATWARKVRALWPLTTLGFFVAAGGGLALRFLALPSSDLVYLMVGYGAVAASALAVLLVIVGAVITGRSARRHGALADRTLETGRSLPTGFQLPGLAFLPFVQVDWRWLEPNAELAVERRAWRLEESAALPRRGVTTVIRRRLRIGDAFGLAAIELEVEQRAPLVTLPHIGALSAMPVLVSMAGGDDIPHPMGVADGDRVELRRYAPGDPARFIHWKVYGRTRKLMVRTPERALTRSRRTVSYLVAGRGDEPSAAAARAAIELGAFGEEWVFGADGAISDTDDVAEAVDRIVRSVDADRRGPTGLRAFIDRAERTGPASLVLFAPPTPGPWLEEARRVLAGRGPRTKVVIAIDGLRADPPPTRLEQVMFRRLPSSALTEPTSIEALDVVVRALRELRVDVVVLDRSTGRRLGAEHLRVIEGSTSEVTKGAA